MSVSIPIIPYTHSRVVYARKLRRRMTMAEVLLWNRLKRRQVLGYDFDRQRSIGDFIVDFYCKALRLAIEVDGCCHDLKQQADADRQARLESLGVHFVRVWDRDVKTDIEGVIETVTHAVRKRANTV